MKARHALLLLVLLAGCVPVAPPGNSGGAPNLPPIVVHPAPQPPKEGGTDFGGGSDFAGRRYNAFWFPKRPEVSFCVNVAQDFGASKSALKHHVVQAFKKWDTYLAERKSLDQELRFDVNYEETCSAQTDLVFEFGTDTPEIHALKAQYASPLGLAQRFPTHGVIWLAPPDSVAPDIEFPDWRKPELIRAALLHEIGHVYGNDHVPGTIMAADLAARLPFMRPQQMTEIDQTRELMTCPECAATYLTRLPGDYPRGQASAAFKLLTERDSQGMVTVSLSIDLTGSTTSLTLFVQDALGHQTFRARRLSRPEIVVKSAGIRIFKTVDYPKSGEPVVRSYFHGGYDLQTTLVAEDGRTIPMRLRVNSGEGSLEMPRGMAQLELISGDQTWELADFPKRWPYLGEDPNVRE